jgi:hypothetical protein
MRRRDFLTLPALAAAPVPSLPARTALCLNEDNSHWFSTRAGQTITPDFVSSFVDQYAGTQVRELILSANSQRTSFASEVWDPIWKGYQPDGPDDQPLLRSTPAASRAGARKWVHTAWDLARKKIDPYSLWIARARQKGLSPWISMRMNDLHNVDDPDSYMHSTFWREHPEFRRVPWRFVDWRDRAFDFAHPEVREYHFRLIEEYCGRYDFDGLELDWMRFGFHFRPGHEIKDGPLLTEFMRRTRRLLDTCEERRGHKIQLGARVPSRPQTAVHLGMDGALWAREGLVQMLVVTPFWASIETDMPMELWRRLCGDRVTLAAGLELLLRPYHDYRPLQFNTLETVRGASASLLSRGADRIYLFNYMDSQTAMPDRENYSTVLRECGRLDTLADKARRHVVTYSDTLAPGEASGAQLPKTLAAGQWAAFRLHVGPRLEKGAVLLKLDGATIGELRVNGALCQAKGADAWNISFAIEGSAVVDVKAAKPGRIDWVEIAMLGAPSFAGFRTPTGRTSPAVSWRIVDGAYETIPDARRQCDLWTAAEYEQFDLRFDWKVAPGANTGIKYLIQQTATDKLKDAQGEFLHETSLGFEFQLVDDASAAGADQANHASGALYNYLAPTERAARPAGEWNTGRLVLRGDDVEHWINDRLVLAYSLHSPELKKALAAKRLNSARMLERLERRRTPIAFQHHESLVAFRAIRLL